MAKLEIRFDAERLLALEQKWDRQLGGADTRPYRELLGFCMGRVLSIGAEPDALANYFVECLAMLRDCPPEGGYFE